MYSVLGCIERETFLLQKGCISRSLFFFKRGTLRDIFVLQKGCIKKNLLLLFLVKISQEKTPQTSERVPFLSNGKDSEWWFPLEQLLVPYSESKGESEKGVGHIAENGSCHNAE